MSDNPVISIVSETVPYGWPESRRRDLPGYMLENGIVLLESERDPSGKYRGGTGMDGMYLQTGRVFEPVYGDGGKVTGFTEYLPQRQAPDQSNGRSDSNMDDEKKTIRFIDSNYKDLFFIKDGENIVLTFQSGEKRTLPCTFLDEYHTKIGSEVLHICQFAEIMERNGTAFKPEKAPELPDKCWSTLPSSGELIMIEKSKKGYTPCPWCEAPQARREADSHNGSFRVTRQQEAAMLGGSLFGWATPAARTSSYDFKGNPIAPTKTKAPKHKDPER